MIRCESDWYAQIREHAARNKQTVTDYVVTCIALGEAVLDGTIWRDPENDFI